MLAYGVHKVLGIKNLSSFSLVFLLCIFCYVPSSWALMPIKISPLDRAVDLSPAVEFHHTLGKTIGLSTVPGQDGIVHRIEVQSEQDSPKGDWGIFALVNPTNEQIDKLIVAPHYRLSGSGVLSPDLGAERIHSISPSEGFALTKEQDSSADVFRVTLNPGATVTFVAELNDNKIPKMYLWQPEAYKDSLSAFSLYHGILLGIAGMLALLLSVLFIVQGTLLFPATASFAWAVLFYIGLDFNFLDKIVHLNPQQLPFYRAATEVLLVVSLSVFLFAYLNVNRWHYQFKYGALAWAVILCAAGAVCLYNPVLASSMARLGFGAATILGSILILYFAFRGIDLAFFLIPTWFFVSFWTVVCFCCITGVVDNDIIQAGLTGGLVLIVLMVAFTIMNQAFSTNAFHHGIFSDLEQQALAVMGAGDTIWDWDVRKKSLHITPDLSPSLGSVGKEIAGSFPKWCSALHPQDRDRFLAALNILLERKEGKLEENLRLRASDNNYLWFKLRARPVLGKNKKLIKCIGTIVNITDHKNAEKQLIYDATHDNLTHLPNEAVLLDRLRLLLNLTEKNEINKTLSPALLLFDFHNFRKINDEYGRPLGDNFLLIIAQRVKRLLTAQDTVSRLKGDRFAILLANATDVKKIASLSEKIIKTITAPVKLPERQVQLSASMGVAPWVDHHTSAEDLLNGAVLALLHAKRKEGNCIEVFTPQLRSTSFDSGQFKKDFAQALLRKEIHFQYQPILRLKDGTLVGFELSAFWHHPRYGVLSSWDIVSALEDYTSLTQFALLLFERAAADLVSLDAKFPKEDYFFSVSFSSPIILAPAFIKELQSLLLRHPVKAQRLKIELPESALTQNPEQTASLLKELKAMGFSLVLDNFNTGYASLFYFVRYPFDIIKMDRALLARTNTRTDKEKILYTLINLAKQFDLKLAAKGVDSEKDVTLLRALGCHYIQSTTFKSHTSFAAIVSFIENYPKLIKSTALPESKKEQETQQPTAEQEQQTSQEEVKD